jgi:serine/threonine-protein kinase
MTAIEIPTPDPRALDDATRPFAEALADRYAIKRLIGRGGMGVVYLARDKRLDRLVAIKTLPPHLSRDAALRERFLRETRTAGAMAHANIVPIHGADEVDGHVFFVMSYIKGESLAARVRAQGRLAPDATRRYLRDVAAALEHAHLRGIVHRDIKAENILIEEDSDRALVTDFGIARLAEASPLTVTGQVLGSVHYVSPEQVSGTHVDARSDIYSLGVVGYHALTGRFPFEGEVASAVLVQHVTRVAAPLGSIHRDLPPALSAIVDRCLSKDPAHRYASAADLLAALDAATDAATPRAPLVSETEAHQVWKRAAELQAATGIQPRPPIVPVDRDRVADAGRASGFGLTEIRDAAQEAGIPERYVAHALGERGLGPSAVAPTRPAAAPPSTEAQPSWWSGVPRHVVREVTVPGELPPRDVERLINVLRDSTGRLGTTLAHRRELSWYTGRLGTRLAVTVVPEADQTTIRVVRDGRRGTLVRAMAALVTTALGIAPATGGILMGMGAPEELAVFAAIGTGVAVLWKGGRRFIARGHKKLSAHVEQVADRLESKVRSSIGRPS